MVTNCDQLPQVINHDLVNINIESLIRIIRGQKVMLDSDLAMLYGVETRALNQAVRRNLKRFPDDFMFQVTKEEWNALRSQIVTLEDLNSQNVISNHSRGDRYLGHSSRHTKNHGKNHGDRFCLNLQIKEKKNRTY